MADNYDPNQPRAPKGSANGGQWVKTPGGGKRPAGSWTIARRKAPAWKSGTKDKDGNWIPGDWTKRDENTVEEDFARARLENEQRKQAEALERKRLSLLEHKRTAAKRFADKQKAAKAKGLRPPAAIRKLLRQQEVAGKIGAGDKINMGAEGVWERARGRFGREIRGPWEQRFVNLGEKSPGGLHRLAEVQDGVHKWKDVTPPKLSTPPPPVEDKAVIHARHKALREAKAIQTFKARKNWAAKNLLLRRKGRPELPHPDAGLVRGQVSPGGKFIRGNKRNKNNKIVRGKGEWRLLPTVERGKPTAARQMPRHLRTGLQSMTGRSLRPIAPMRSNRLMPRPSPKHSPTPEVRLADDKQLSVRKIKFGKEGQGIFQKQFVEVQENGRKAILKSNGYGNNGFHGFEKGFAIREIAAYQLSEQLGLGVVPETVPFECTANPLYRNHGPVHSLQYLVPDAEDGENLNHERFHNSLTDKTELGKMFLLDCIMGNPNRHGQNWMGAKDSKGDAHLYAIDNGLQMFEEEHDAPVMLRRWRCELKGVYKKQLPLQNSYKAKLQKMIDDGSIQKIVDYVDKNTVSREPGLQEQFKEAVGLRAQSIVDNWDALFSENPDKGGRRW